MWIYLNNSFLSVVQHKDNPKLLHVRARKKGDIEAVFHQARVTHTPSGDYKYRTNMGREVMARAMRSQLIALQYTNFKNSVKDPERKMAYMDTWSAAHGLHSQGDAFAAIGMLSSKCIPDDEDEGHDFYGEPG